MSLRIWLPLNGNLKNQGLNTYTISNTGVTDSLGKIGSCYSYSQKYTLIEGDSISGLLKFTISCWVYLTNASTYNIFTSEDANGYWQFLLGNNYIRVRDSVSGVTGSRIDKTITAIPSSVWVHITVVYDEGVVKVYQNGVLKDTLSFHSGAAMNAHNKMYLGADGLNGVSSYPGNCKINDFRVYDHCLSDKEVSEISKGLVLHYRFNDKYNEGTSNLVPNSSTFSGWSPYTNGYTSISDSEIGDKKVVITNKGTWCGIYKSLTLPSAGTYTISVWCKPISRSSTSVNQTLYTGGGGIGDTNVYVSWDKPGEWQRISMTKTYTNTSLTLYLIAYGGTRGTDTVSCEYTMPQIEAKDHVTPYTSGTRTPVCTDSSGYEYDGTIGGSLIVGNDTAKYDHSTKFGNGVYVSPSVFPSFLTNEATVSMWVKLDQLPPSSPGRTMLYTAWYGFSCEITSAGKTYFRTQLTSGSQDSPSGTISVGKWVHWVGVKSSTGVSLYLDGVLVGKSSNTANFNWSSNVNNRIASYNNSYFLYGNLSDVRLYSTALSDKDIKELYSVGASIDNKDNTHSYQLNEEYLNLCSLAEYGIATKQWIGGLSSYTQANCQCTLTNDGYRIYRPENKTVSGDGNTMWGGFVLNNGEDNYFGFQDNHTYMLQFEVKGKSSNNVSSVYWTNYVGWGGGGLNPTGTSVKYWNPVTTNYNSDQWKTFTYVWTINDGLYKTCTSAYAHYVAGNKYMSYKGFKFGFDYTNTGTLGTDLYIKNVRLYDITNGKKASINKSGTMSMVDFVECDSNSQIINGCSFISKQFIEY